ncbi:hypothetical protein TNCV_780831 [Trichonephila clavipes]|nr:hypothetical protein TNCV_780831 [Trichonephila clavipes]
MPEEMQLPMHFSVGRIFKNKGVSEFRIRIHVPHPKMQLVPTFGAPATASFVPEGMCSTIIRRYWSF